MRSTREILITNDDGIHSEGLAILAKWATKLGEVWISAPADQQSGKSHAIQIHQPFKIEETTLGLGETKAFAVHSTPVDCVRFATLGLNQHYDLIFSGINKGYNMGEDILLHKRTGDDIWKNLYELPLIEVDHDMQETELLASGAFRALFAEGETPLVRVMQRGVKHVLSHRVIYANFYGVELPQNSRSFSGYTRIKIADLENYALPRLVHAFLENQL